jgi:hypothetical protein
MDPEYGIPGLGTYAAAGWGGEGTPASYSPPSAEAMAGARSPSQIPGTSGAPGGYTPAATPGGVSTGAGTGTAGSPWGSIAGMLGLGGAAGGAPRPFGGGMAPPQARTMEQLGMRMLGPPGNPMRPGAPSPQLSTAGQNPMVRQFMQMFGVDYPTALRMMTMLHPGSTTMQPGQQSQMLFGGGAFQPSSMPPTTPSPLLPSSAMPTPQNPYAVPRGPTAGGPMQPLPPLGGGAFMPGGGAPPSLQSQMLYGALA